MLGKENRKSCMCYVVRQYSTANGSFIFFQLQFFLFCTAQIRTNLNYWMTTSQREKKKTNPKNLWETLRETEPDEKRENDVNVSFFIRPIKTKTKFVRWPEMANEFLISPSRHVSLCPKEKNEKRKTKNKKKTNSMNNCATAFILCVAMSLDAVAEVHRTKNSK